MKRSSKGKRLTTETLPEQVAKAFGLRLQEMRRDREINQGMFAEEMGLSRTTISNIECGRQRIFLDQLYQAALILQVEIADLLPSLIPTDERPRVRSAVDDPLSTKEVKSVEEALKNLKVEELTEKTKRSRR